MIARVAALGFLHSLRLPFEVGAGEIVEQDLAVGIEEITPAFLQVCEQRILVLHGLVERTVEPVLAATAASQPSRKSMAVRPNQRS